MTIGLIGGSIGYSMFGLSKTGVLFWLGIPFLNMMSFTPGPPPRVFSPARPAPPSRASSRGAISNLRGIAGLVGPGLFSPTSSANPSARVSIYRHTLLRRDGLASSSRSFITGQHRKAKHKPPELQHAYFSSTVPDSSSGLPIAGILPCGRDILVVAAKSDVGAITVAEFQRLVFGNGNRDRASETGVRLLA